MLVWCDLETTGLDPDVDRILEIALVITDDHDFTPLWTFSEVLRQDDDFDPKALDDFIIAMHTKSGLLDDLTNPNVAFHDASWVETFLVREFTEHHCFPALRDTGFPENTPLAGSNVSFDRDFLRHHMPRFEELFHFRNVDVSSFKELVNRWSADVQEKRHEVRGEAAHRALPDIHESIGELQFYREHIWRTYEERESDRLRNYRDKAFMGIARQNTANVMGVRLD